MIRLDGREMRTRGETHDYLQRMLSLPEYYGRNLDALHDCLTDVGGPLEIELVHVDVLMENLGVYGKMLVRVFEDAAEENPEISIQMHA